MAIGAARPRQLSRSMDLSGVRIETARLRSERAVATFWRWWSEGGCRRTTAAIESGNARRVVPEITSLIEAIDPGLSWEFVPASEGDPHRLTVTAAGVPELRGVARRWLAQAPPDDSEWTFADLRDPVPGRAMHFRDRRLGFDEAEVVVDVGLSRADVTVHHPGFAGLVGSDPSIAAYLLLDAMCGEAAVETWVGTIRSNATAPGDDAVSLYALPGILREIEQENTDEAGEPAWQILHGDTSQGPMVAVVRVPLVALSAPEFDRHVAVHVPYTDVEDCGLPGSGSLPGLRDLEDHLVDRLEGTGECVGAESCNGRRLLHFYVDSTTPAHEQLRVACSGWDQGEVTLTVTDDPGWRKVQHLRV
ncbi:MULTISPECIES: DUF695 domain-containing protein [unclassified Dietzia]|uniref:DUF695 domain-containing protein n=1 Tax=unclassified Dietzia TaxID=2617939 RepID=UPI000D2297A4|nr:MULTISPECIES: DUF695 domain-containing protein [unclassified Dietzia]AVZ40032.1 DUF695 domain-containing protein [Dietzia sp. JS16-p6b]QGW25447.1 hypothetical protein GJR88_03731 [Dietzia sp. DQ12-45-1b]